MICTNCGSDRISVGIDGSWNCLDCGFGIYYSTSGTITIGETDNRSGLCPCCGSYLLRESEPGRAVEQCMKCSYIVEVTYG